MEFDLSPKMSAADIRKIEIEGFVGAIDQLSKSLAANQECEYVCPVTILRPLQLIRLEELLKIAIEKSLHATALRIVMESLPQPSCEDTSPYFKNSFEKLLREADRGNFSGVDQIIGREPIEQTIQLIKAAIEYQLPNLLGHILNLPDFIQFYLTEAQMFLTTIESEINEDGYHNNQAIALEIAKFIISQQKDISPDYLLIGLLLFNVENSEVKISQLPDIIATLKELLGLPKVDITILDELFGQYDWIELYFARNTPNSIAGFLELAPSIAVINDPAFEIQNLYFQELFHLLEDSPTISYKQKRDVINQLPKFGLNFNCALAYVTEDLEQFVIENCEDKQLAINQLFLGRAAEDSTAALRLLGKFTQISDDAIFSAIKDDLIFPHQDNNRENDGGVGIDDLDFLSFCINRINLPTLEELFTHLSTIKKNELSAFGEILQNLSLVVGDKTPAKSLHAIKDAFPKFRDQLLIHGIDERELQNGLMRFAQQRKADDRKNIFFATHLGTLAFESAVVASAIEEVNTRRELLDLFSIILANTFVAAAQFSGRPSEFVRHGDRSSLIGLSDLIEEFRDSYLLPAISAKFFSPDIIRQLSEPKIDSFRQELNYLSSRLVIDRLPVNQIRRFNFMWHQPRHRMPIEARPLLKDSSWYALFPETRLPNGITISCLTTPLDLRFEGDSLHHCIGHGGYGSSALRGDSHLISIRENDVPIATIELKNSNDGDLKINSSACFKVSQFYGEHNTAPSKKARNAWKEMTKKLKSGAVKISEKRGSIFNSIDKSEPISKFELVTGIRGKDFPTAAMEYWSSLRLLGDRKQVQYNLLEDPVRTLQFEDSRLARLVVKTFPNK